VTVLVETYSVNPVGHLLTVAATVLDFAMVVLPLFHLIVVFVKVLLGVKVPFPAVSVAWLHPVTGLLLAVTLPLNLLQVTIVAAAGDPKAVGTVTANRTGTATDAVKTAISRRKVSPRLYGCFSGHVQANLAVIHRATLWVRNCC
jgi:hypothetical protein